MAEHAVTESLFESEWHTGYNVAYELSQTAGKPTIVTIAVLACGIVVFMKRRYQ